MSESNPGVNKLANTLSSRMKLENHNPLVLDFGSIKSDYSLQTNTFPIPIPKSDYTICRNLALGKSGSFAVTEDTNDHFHNVLIPNTLRSLSPGDRVLVAWVQNEAVVIDIIVSTSNL